MLDIPRRCKQARENAGLSVRELALVMGCARKTIDRMEAETDTTPDIPLSTYVLFAKHTNTELEDLLFEKTRQQQRELDLLSIKVSLMEYIDKIASNTDK